MDTTLREALRKHRALRTQLENMLLGDDGDVVEAELKKFVTKRPCWVTKKLLSTTLYLHENQKNGGFIRGFELEAHLKETGLINLCFSLEDEVVKGWFNNPETYPEEFKKKSIYLWKSAPAQGAYRRAPYLDWVGGRVVVIWRWLDDCWYGLEPALLASPA